jgi:hypothetical protein
MPQTPKPTVGAIVHYVPKGAHAPCRAALVVETDGTYSATLAVFTPDGIDSRHAMADFTERQGNTWHWPEVAR